MSIIVVFFIYDCIIHNIVKTGPKTESIEQTTKVTLITKNIVFFTVGHSEDITVVVVVLQVNQLKRKSPETAKEESLATFQAHLADTFDRWSDLG